MGKKLWEICKKVGKVNPQHNAQIATKSIRKQQMRPTVLEKFKVSVDWMLGMGQCHLFAAIDHCRLVDTVESQLHSQDIRYDGLDNPA